MLFSEDILKKLVFIKEDNKGEYKQDNTISVF